MKGSGGLTCSKNGDTEERVIPRYVCEPPYQRLTIARRARSLFEAHGLADEWLEVLAGDRSFVTSVQILEFLKGQGIAAGRSRCRDAPSTAPEHQEEASPACQEGFPHAARGEGNAQCRQRDGRQSEVQAMTRPRRGSAEAARAKMQTNLADLDAGEGLYDRHMRYPLAEGADSELEEVSDRQAPPVATSPPAEGADNVMEVSDRKAHPTAATPGRLTPSVDGASPAMCERFVVEDDTQFPHAIAIVVAFTDPATRFMQGGCGELFHVDIVKFTSREALHKHGATATLQKRSIADCWVRQVQQGAD